MKYAIILYYRSTKTKIITGFTNTPKTPILFAETDRVEYTVELRETSHLYIDLPLDSTAYYHFQQ